MKKYLMILSSIVGILVGTVANVVNNQANTNKINLVIENQEIKQSLDISKYDITNDTFAEIQLNNLLNLIKNINKERKEKQAQIEMYQIPKWNLISDDNQIFALGWSFEGVKNLTNLINSDLVQFKNVQMNLSKKYIEVNLDYKIADIEQTIPLFTFTNEYNKIPLKQEQMQTAFQIIYSYEL